MDARIVACLWVAVGSLLVGCAQQATDPINLPSPQPVRQVHPSAAPDHPIAQIDGHKIMRSEFDDLLVEAHGLTVLQQMIMAIQARQATADAGITITQADVDAEYARQLNRIYPISDQPGGPDVRRLQERALARVLQDQQLSRAEFMLKVGRDAHIRALAAQRLTITPDDLQREYRALYGPKVQVRIVSCRTLQDAGRARQRVTAGEDFATVAAEMSTNPIAVESGGLTEPFSPDDPTIDPLLRKTIERLEPGQTSETIRVGLEYLVIRLEQRTEPADVAYDDVRDAVARACRQRKLDQLSDQIIARLIRSARLTIYEPSLRDQYNQRRAEFGGVAPALSSPGAQ